MPDQKSQIKLTISDKFAEAVRKNQKDPTLQPLMDVLKKHNATLQNRLDFAEAASKAPKDSRVGDFFRNQIKTAKNELRKEFYIYVDEHSIFDKRIADSIEADLAQITGTGQLIESLHQNVQPKSLG